MNGLALVTGASSGLGKALALELARRGHPLLLMARDETRLAQTASEARQLRVEATAVAADVRDGATVKEAVTRALAGRPLHVAVHAAGVLLMRDVESTTDDDFRACLETNVLGSAHVVQATLPALAASRGRLGLIASITGILALPGGFGAYAASKWGLRGYAETVRRELRARGVSLTVAYPSILDTPMIHALGPEAPAVYRAFTWHPPEHAARVIVRHVEARRRESFVTALDRVAALGMRLAPATFTAGMDAWIRWKGER
jgi:short-subunit dehydrogenase